MNLKPILALACLAGSITSALAGDAAKLFEALRPSIVLISSAEGIGSGIVISGDGLILTNLHVAGTPLPLSVKATVIQAGKKEDRTFEGLQLTKAHLSRDLALLKIDAPGVRFVPARLSKSARDTKAGDTCFALGFPYLPGQTRSDLTITQGLISSASRQIEGQEYIQLDAVIMPGNSGGALVNSDGTVVGIPTLRFEGEARVGLAIPLAGLSMQDFVAPGDRKGNADEADRLERMASAYLARDVFSYSGDPVSALVALQLLRESLNLDPSNARRFGLVADTYRRLGVLEPARAYAEKAVSLDPSSFGRRATLAVICEDLEDDEATLENFAACLPLLDENVSEFKKRELFRKLISRLQGRDEALRTLYVISWSKAVFGGPLPLEHQIFANRISRVLPEALVQSILAKEGGHSIAEMQALAMEYPQLVPKDSIEEIQPVVPSMVKEESVANTVIVSKVSFAKGDVAQLSDAPAGVAYKAGEGVLEWTPAPFSAEMEINVLFLVTHPDGTEKTLIHTIKREP